MNAPPEIDEPREPAESLHGKRVRLVGRFVSVSQREAAAAVVRRGGVIDSANPEWIVLGEAATDADRLAAQTAVTDLPIECFDECELWRRLGLVDETQGVSRLYSPAMLSELVGAPLTAIRRWIRRGMLRPVRRVNRLAYFDFAEARIAQILSELLRERRSLTAVEAIVDQLEAAFASHDRPLAQLPLVVVRGDLLLRSDDQLIETTGQRCFSFEGEEDQPSLSEEPVVLSMGSPAAAGPATLRQRAWELADGGDVDRAIEAWRLVMLESLPAADDHFALAEWLYRAGQTEAARERYYATLELDSEHVEARVSLGCLLSDGGDHDLAIAAFQGALEQHEDFADAHYHLARALVSNDHAAAAERHWRRFLEIAPEGPWADEARERLDEL